MPGNKVYFDVTSSSYPGNSTAYTNVYNLGTDGIQANDVYWTVASGEVHRYTSGTSFSNITPVNTNTVTTNAITNAEVSSPSNTNTNGTSIQTMGTHSWVSTGAETFAAISFTRSGSGRSGRYSGTVYVYHGSSLKQSYSGNGDNNEEVRDCITFQLNPSAGTNYLYLKAKESTSQDRLDFDEIRMFTLETKR